MTDKWLKIQMHMNVYLEPKAHFWIRQTWENILFFLQDSVFSIHSCGDASFRLLPV